MSEIDFEKIRLDALRETMESVPQDGYGKAVALSAEMASKVTQKMLEAYHSACKHLQTD